MGLQRAFPSAPVLTYARVRSAPVLGKHPFRRILILSGARIP